VDRDGTIISYKWTKQRGPLAKVTESMDGSATVYIAQEGEYIFKLTVTDNVGDKDSDYVKVYVGSEFNYKVADARSMTNPLQ
jgi:hypothetical protein